MLHLTISTLWMVFQHGFNVHLPFLTGLRGLEAGRRIFNLICLDASSCTPPLKWKDKKIQMETPSNQVCLLVAWFTVHHQIDRSKYKRREIWMKWKGGKIMRRWYEINTFCHNDLNPWHSKCPRVTGSSTRVPNEVHPAVPYVLATTSALSTKKNESGTPSQAADFLTVCWRDIWSGVKGKF